MHATQPRTQQDNMRKIMNKTPCPVVFDLDGTLIDSAPDIHACVNAVLAAHRIAPLSLDRIRSFIGGGVPLLWSRIIDACGIDPVHRRTLVSGFMTRYHDATMLTRLYPNVPEALSVLANAGHPLGICTNKPLAPTLHILKHFGLSNCFNSVIAGDSLPQRKPDPAPLQAAFAALAPGEVKPYGLFVGDSEFDADCAANMAAPFLLFTRGYRQTPVSQLTWAAHFDDFATLPDLVAEAGLSEAMP
ncbi:MAG: phosphoglycolate phosphatase [Paracoccus sp. (in: a-proteobacteria)]|nr:phosphoglycolate phosphatase [Paracoccus sp. (in: a-proteobacteria)]